MYKLPARTILLLASALCAGAAAAQTPLGTAFTYQGRLGDAGASADGAYDFIFQLCDAATGGNVLGTVVRDDLPVVDGLFSTELDFGASPFGADARWLEISVRLGSHVVPPTVLTPRQKITAAPYASYALQSAQWRSVGDNVTNTAGDFVGINRAEPVSTAEFFGVQAPVQSGYGGMYIRTDGAAAKPFYGYSNGAQSAWTYLDGTTGDWRVNNGGDRLTVTSSGRVGIGTTAPTARLHVVGGGEPDALFATNSSTGRAAEFSLPAGSSGNAVYGVTYGNGKAAQFESHSANATPAVSVFKNAGTAIAATGHVEVNGEVRTRFGNGMARGTPIAYGKYQILPSGATILLSSSGNVIVTGAGEVSTVSISGESDPEEWLVISNLVYADTSNPLPRYRLLPGSPNANGSIQFRLVCVDHCDSQPNTDKFIHFAVFKP